jgi:hypothetical protein
VNTIGTLLVVAVDPAEAAQRVCEGCKTGLIVGVTLGRFGEKDVNAAEPVALLGQYHQWRYRRDRS